MSVLAWLADPPPHRGIRIAERDGAWRFTPYPELARLTRRAAYGLRAGGVSPGDVVVIVRPASIEFVAEFFGALLAGATPSPVAPPTAFRDPEAYADHVARAVRLVGAPVVTTTPESAPVVRSAVADAGCRVLTGVCSSAGTLDGPPIPPATGVVQFSSGSTGMPRAVRIPFTALESNVGALAHTLRLTDRDAAASWLPTHHDMGLIGLLLLPLYRQLDLSLMRPEDFIRAPSRWLHRFGPGGATMTGAPAFGLAHIVRRVRPHHLTGLDLSGWRGIVVGAERVDAAIIRDFLDLLAPYGLRRDVIIPAYGLAESTLAVTAAPCATALTTLTIDTPSMVVGRPVVTVPNGGNGATLVGCGTPVRGVGIRIVDEDGRPVDEGVLGEIEVRGDSLASGHVSEAGGEEPIGSRLRTGDAGFLHGGQLFVVGRLGDAVKQFGRWFFAEDAEQIAVTHSPRPRQTVALIGSLTGRNTAAVLVEGSLDGVAEGIGRAVARYLTGLRVIVLAVRSGEIARTTSGKPKRRTMWRRLADGELRATLCWDSDPPVIEASPKSL